MRLSGHQVLITGGASGIGLALAREFARRDNRVTVCGRDQNKLDLVAKSSPEIGTIACDITTPEGLAVLEERFADPEKGVSILVNNAATGDAYCFARDRDAVEKFERELQTNLVAPARLIKCLLPALASHPEAAIVNMTSGFALCPSPAVPGYSAAKHGLRAFSKVLRQQLEGSGVRVFEVLPPMVETTLVEQVDVQKMSPEKVARAIVAGMERNHFEICIGLVRLLRWSLRIMPGLVDLVMKRYPIRLADLDQLYPHDQR